MTQFVVASAEVAAHDVLADRIRFVLEPEHWAAFSSAIDRKPRVVRRDLVAERLAEIVARV